MKILSFGVLLLALVGTGPLATPMVLKPSLGNLFVFYLPCPYFFYRTLYQKLASVPKNLLFAQKHKQMFIIVGWVNRIIVFSTILTIFDISKSLRDMIFMFQGILACVAALGTLAHTHKLGPTLPKERPPPKTQ